MLRFSCIVLSLLLPLATVVAAGEQPRQTESESISTARASITDFGAVGDGSTLNTKAIQSAIDQLAEKGGRTVVVPKGVFITGALFFRPGVNLHLENGAVLKGSTDMKNYPERRIRIEGHFEEHFASGLINAEGCDGLRIDGEGTLDGSGRPTWDRFWRLARTTKLLEKAEIPTISRPQLCIINNSKNVTVEGVTFKDSAFWNLHLYNCRNVTVRQARFQVPDNYKRAPSTDGVDVDSCQDVEIDGCYFSVTDDCICLKGNRYDGINQEPPSLPVQNVVVKNCIFERGDGALTFGSEAQSISEVEMKDSVVRGKMPMLRIKFRPDTANQDYRNVHVHDIKLGGTQGEIVRVSPNHGTKVPTPKAPISQASGIVIENVSGTFGSFGTLAGGGVAAVSDITLRNIHVAVTKNSELNTNGVHSLKLEDVLVTKSFERNAKGVNGAQFNDVKDVREQTRRFENGALTDHVPWLDTSGNLINAHDGGIIYAEGKYHWYGMALRPMSVKEGGQKTTTGVVMYSSTNLYDWTYEGVILACSTDPKSPLYGPMRFERPKIIYNDCTKTYVMWFHYVQRPGNHTEKMGGGEAGIATCSTVNDKYVFHGTVRPIDDRGIVRDSTLFKDDDGSAYFIYDRDIRIPGQDFGRVLHIVKLSDDYLKPTTNYFKIDVAARREAPVMIKRNGCYFLITSGLTSWKFNPEKYFRATNIFGPYTDMGDPCAGESTETTFNTQGTYAFAVQGKPDEIIFLCERHYTVRMTESSFVFLPVLFPTPETLQLRYLPEWNWETWAN